MYKILELIKSHYKMIAFFVIILFVIYGVLFVFVPTVKMSELSLYKLNELQKQISNFEENQKKMDSLIVNYTTEINDLEDKISKIKNEKTIIKEIYHEEINRVDNYDDHQLDSFFAKRYGYYPR